MLTPLAEAAAQPLPRADARAPSVSERARAG
jgi:hypothetical protein